MENSRLIDGEVGRLLEGGYSNAEGGTMAVQNPDARVSQMDTAGLQGIVTKTVKRRPEYSTLKRSSKRIRFGSETKYVYGYEACGQFISDKKLKNSRFNNAQEWANSFCFPNLRAVVKTIQTPIAEVDYMVNTTVNPENFDNRPVQIAADNADAGSRGTADVEPDMIAGEQVLPTYDPRSSEETITQTTTTSAPAKTGLTEQQKNIAWGIGLVVVAVGSYFVIKNYVKV